MLTIKTINWRQNKDKGQSSWRTAEEAVKEAVEEVANKAAKDIANKVARQTVQEISRCL